MNILVTGGTGFIGLHLVRRLSGLGHNVTCLVRKTSKTEQLRCIKVPFICYEDAFGGKLHFSDFDVLYHLAAIRHRYGIAEDEYLSANVNMTRELLNALVNNVKLFILCSSISVFGWPKKLPIDEKNPFCPLNAYARSKVKSEILVKEFVSNHKIQTVIIRPSITYGPEDSTGMITKLMTLIHQKRYLTVGSGKNRVQLCYIDDLIDAFVAAINNPKAIGQDFNITAQYPICINELTRKIANIMNKNLPRIKIPIFLARITAFFCEGLYRSGIKIMGNEPVIAREKIATMITDRCYDISKAQEILQFQPKYDYHEGLRRTYDWFCKRIG